MIDLIDISVWNDIQDWNLVKQNVGGVLIRTSQNNWEDFTFKDKYANARSVGLPIGLWHFFQPNISDYAQSRMFLNIYNSLPIKHRPIVDCEEIDYWVNGEHVQIYPPSKTTYTQWIRSYLQTIETDTGIIPMVYTRASFWNEWVESGDWNHYPLWVANYGVEIPLLPQGWSNYVFHQKGQFYCPGIPKPVDHDVYRGDQASLNLFLDGTAILPPPEPDVNYLNGKVVASNGVNVRTGPGTNYPVVRVALYGTMVKIINLNAPQTVWGKLEDGNWMALKYNAEELVRIV